MKVDNLTMKVANLTQRAKSCSERRMANVSWRNLHVGCSPGSPERFHSFQKHSGGVFNVDCIKFQNHDFGDFVSEIRLILTPYSRFSLQNMKYSLSTILSTIS